MLFAVHHMPQGGSQTGWLRSAEILQLTGRSQLLARSGLHVCTESAWHPDVPNQGALAFARCRLRAVHRPFTPLHALMSSVLQSPSTCFLREQDGNVSSESTWACCLHCRRLKAYRLSSNAGERGNLVTQGPFRKTHAHSRQEPQGISRRRRLSTSGPWIAPIELGVPAATHQPKAQLVPAPLSPHSQEFEHLGNVVTTMGGALGQFLLGSLIQPSHHRHLHMCIGCLLSP